MGGRWIIPAKKCTFPRHIASVIVESRPVGPESRHGKTMTAWSGAYAMLSSWRGGTWSPSRPVHFDDPDALHSYVEAIAPSRGSLRVVSPVASRALTLSRLWDRWDRLGVSWTPRGGNAPEGASPREGRSAGGRVLRTGKRRVIQPIPNPQAKYIVSRLVLRGKPDIVSYRVDDKSITWVSGWQYLTGSERGLASSVGFAWPRSGGEPGVGAVKLMHGADRCELWLRLFQKLADWWREVDGGPWSNTVGGLSLSYFRHRLAPKVILSHDNDDARRLEELSIFGGRASLWYYGDVGDTAAAVDPQSPPPPPASYGREAGPLEMWDVRSMYNTILSHGRFPVRYRHLWQAPSVSAVREMVRSWLVVASVRLKSDRAEYPRRSDLRVIYPTGEYDVVLTTPELVRALDSDSVLRVYSATTYDGGNPFQQFGVSLAAHRDVFLRRGDAAFEQFTKLLSNNLGGKFAQRKHGWRSLPGVVPEQRWGEWVERVAGTGERQRFRALAGLVWAAVPATHHGRPLAACFAHLTAYGRVLMADLRASLDPRSVVSQDTDGVWVRRPPATAWQRAATLLSGLGFRLAPPRTESCGRWYGPRHYWTPAGWTLSGFHDPSVWSDGLTIEDSYTVDPVISSSSVCPSWVWECRRTTELSTLERDGRVGPDGWITPTVYK